MPIVAAMSPACRHLAGAPGPPRAGYDADIVILSLDRLDDTLAAIASAQAQRGLSHHIFVLDQGSRPEGLAALARVIDGRAETTLVQLDRNRGVAGGRAFGAGLGSGRFLAALDNDASFADAFTLAAAIAALEADPRLGALGLRIVVHATGADDLLSWGYPAALVARAGGSFETATFVGAGHVIRRAAWEDSGGYTEALFFCWEELDFCLQIIDRGWRVRYRGDIVVRHRISQEARVDWAGRRWVQFVRNRLWIERAWHGTGLRFWARACGYLVKGGRNGLWRPSLAGLAAALGARGIKRRGPQAAFARDYLRATDGAYRGSWLRRIGGELFARLPGRAATPHPG